MLRVAVYVRVSTDEQAHSAATQESEARRYAQAQGWEVVAVYKDVGVSGAEFRTRPELPHLIADAKSTPRPWDVVVVRDLDRIGRDGPRTQLAIEALMETGARLCTYHDGREHTSDPMAKAMVAMAGAMAEMERANIARRTREGHSSRARQGLVTGGSVYGYKNVRSPTGVTLEVHPEQAGIVREIFARYAKGEGLRSIAHDLNSRGVPSPRAAGGGTGSWAQSCLYAMVDRDIYRGVKTWGRTGSVYKGGTKVAVVRPDDALIRTPVPTATIIDDALWVTVQARRGDRARHNGKPPVGRPARYMLSGLARCSGCGGPMMVTNSGMGSGSTRRLVKVYTCAYARDRGESVCSNRVRRPVEEVDRAVVGWILDHVLHPDMVDAVIADVRAIVEAQAGESPDAAEVLTLEAGLRRVQTEITRLTTAITSTDAPPRALVQAMVAKEALAKDLRQRLATLRASTSSTTPPWEALEASARDRVADLRARVQGGSKRAREVLQALVQGPITCTVVDRNGVPRFRLSGTLVIPRVFDVTANQNPNEATPTGIEPVLPA